jgi:SAM-dependent methyltransferase
MPAPVRRDWYDTPLFYDIIFDADTVKEADFLEAVARLHGKTRGKAVLELACGSGRLIKELASRHWEAAGFDLNPEMLAFARQRLASSGIEALLWQDRMESFRVPRRRRFDLVHCLVSTFKYLLTEEDALGCLQGVAAVLKPGGLLVLGVHLTEASAARPTHERWVARRDGIEVVCNTRTWPPHPGTRLEPMRSRLRVTLADGRIESQETQWEVRSYTAAQLRSLLRKSGEFEVLACHDFRHEIGEKRRFNDEYSDLVLILGRR